MVPCCFKPSFLYSHPCLFILFEYGERYPPNAGHIFGGISFSDTAQVFSKDLSVDIYFARPYCSNDRARNENTNGLLRQYFPKKFKFDTITPVQLQRVVEEINNRPRKTLGYRTPAEVFNQEGVAFRV